MQLHLALEFFLEMAGQWLGRGGQDIRVLHLGATSGFAVSHGTRPSCSWASVSPSAKWEGATSQPRTWLLTCVCLLPGSWGWCGGRAALLGALTLTGGVEAVSGHRVFLHSLGARGERREAGHEGAQHQDEAQGCHLEVERVWWAEPGQGRAATQATPKALPLPHHEPVGAKGSSFFSGNLLPEPMWWRRR